MFTQNKICSLIISISTIVFLCSPVHAWIEPTTIPPGNNIYAPLNSSSFGQSKIGGLILNIGNAAHGLIVRYGLVGIGTDNPESKLDVRGETKTDSLTVRGNATVNGSVSAVGNIATNNSLCINGDCKSAWPVVAPSSNDTLQTVTDRGATTNKNIITGNLSTPILYDQNNTGYYVNPDSWTNLNGTIANDTRSSIYYDKDNTGYYVNPNGSSNLNAVYGDYFHTARNDSWFPYPGNNYNYLRGHTFINGVLYDENNSGYYLDPNGWSSLELVNVHNHLCIRGDCRPNWNIPRRHCFWIRLETHWMASCPDGYHVDGMALTNASAGCWEAGCQGGQSSWVTAGGFLCCND